MKSRENYIVGNIVHGLSLNKFRLISISSRSQSYFTVAHNNSCAWAIKCFTRYMYISQGSSNWVFDRDLNFVERDRKVLDGD